MPFWRSDARPTMDPEFDFFTEEQGARFRRLAQEGFASAGVEVVPHAQHLEAADGQQYGLFNLAATCHQAPGGEREWPGLVRDHVTRLLRGMQRDRVEDMSADEILSKVFLRLMGTTTLPPEWRDWCSYARPLGGDLVEVLAVDLPDTVSILRDQDVRRVGAEPLRAAALENLLADPVESHQVIQGAGSASIHVVEGESVFTASKLLVLDDLLRRTVGERELPHGVLVSVPIRHLVAFHPIEDFRALGAVEALARLTASLFGDSPGGVSPSLYWWKDSELTQLSTLTDRGELEIQIGDEFTAVLEELGPPVR